MEISVCDGPLGQSLDHRQSLSPTPLSPGRDYEIEALRHCETGKLYLEAGRYPEALQQFEQALTVHPHDVESWYGRADALACLSRYDEALHSLEQGQALAGFADARQSVQKAVLLILLNQPEAALNCCNHALWLEPHHTQAWLFRGVALHRLGQFRAAHRSYRRVARPATAPSTDSMRRLCHDIGLDYQAS